MKGQGQARPGRGLARPIRLRLRTGKKRLLKLAGSSSPRRHSAGTRGYYPGGLRLRGTSMPHKSEITKVQETNIEKVVRLEAEAEQRASSTDRISEAIGSFTGTNYFILLQLACVGFWLSINTGALRVIPAFDPYPFPLLATLLALEGVLLVAFVLISQKRISQRAEHRSHLDLQINLLAEKEVTKVIQLLQRLNRHMGLEAEVADAEARELSEDTAVEDLALGLRKSLDPEAGKQG
jgi:uncharacterized membrane protein